MISTKQFYIALAVMLCIILLLSGVILYGIHSQQVADAKADERIKANEEQIKVRDKERDKEREDYKQKFEQLEKQKKEPATANEVAMLLAPYLSKGSQQPIIIEHKDEHGNAVPDAPSGLLFEGKSLTDLRNREISCKECELAREDQTKEIIRLSKDNKSLDDSLKSSEKARKKSKWRRVGDTVVKGAVFVGGVYLGMKIGSKK
jgi:hypothetical protein